MASDATTAPDARGADAHAADHPSMTGLLKGILDDGMALMRQQLAMFKAELKADLGKVVYGVLLLAGGAVPMLLAGLMLCFMLVHLLHWATTPPAAADPASIPLWGCYGIVAGAFLLLGGVLLALGVHRLKTVNPLPDESARALEDNVKWLMNPK